MNWFLDLCRYEKDNLSKWLVPLCPLFTASALSIFLLSSYELVRTLHHRVENAVGPLVKMKVENKLQEGEGQELSHIASEVIE